MVAKHTICGWYPLHFIGKQTVLRELGASAEFVLARQGSVMSHIWTLNPKKKSPKMIIDLIKRNNKASREQLKKISQSDIWNATYELKFGVHNNTGIHGGVPWDLLHWIRLNWFKNTRDCLFEQTGETSKLSKSVDALCIVM